MPPDQIKQIRPAVAGNRFRHRLCHQFPHWLPELFSLHMCSQPAQGQGLRKNRIHAQLPLDHHNLFLLLLGGIS